MIYLELTPGPVLENETWWGMPDNESIKKLTHTLQYYPDKRYSPTFFTPANIKYVTVYVTVGQREKFMTLMFYAKFKDVIECDPEEKWAELTAGGN